MATAYLAPTVRWLAAQPSVQGALVALAQTEYVQTASLMISGSPDVTPETLLAVILGALTTYFLIVCSLPKGRLGLYAFCYFFLSGDKKVRKPDDAPADVHAPSCKRMKVVFIRHGESEWNAVFNEGPKITMPFRLIRALISEAFMTFEQDSLFMDSPLSDVGIKQGWDLMTFLASQPTRNLDASVTSRPVRDLEVADLVSIIRGDSGDSIVCSSILRRAISTGFICLSPRFLKTPQQKDKVQLMTCLQEISRNVDTLSLTPAKTSPLIPAGESKLKHMGDLMSHFYRTRFDKRQNDGNKTLGQKAIKRHAHFVKWLLEQKTDCVVVLGHSLWFREFFKSYLPKASKHEAKTSKMVNCGCIAFDFYRDSKNVHRIPPESIKEIYGGFQGAKKGKKKHA